MADSAAPTHRSWAVLLLAYGGPKTLKDVEPFLRRIMRPVEPGPEIVRRAVERYRAIGGGSPLVENTIAQATALQTHLRKDARGADAEPTGRRDAGADAAGVFLGMRHTAPWIADGLAEALAFGQGRVVVVVMASHQSARATGGYHTDVEQALEGQKTGGDVSESVTFVSPWHTSPGYLDAVADRVREARARLPGGGEDGPLVVFSAHSLPLVQGEGDPEYESALFDTARGVAARVGDVEWRLAYQSRSGRPGIEWLGPGVEDVLAEEAGRGRRQVVVVPLGFVVEHLETLYDLDIALKEECDRLGLAMSRAATVRDHPSFIAAIAAATKQAAVSCGWDGTSVEETV